MSADIPLKLVRQENRSSGCGVACIAMLTGKSYDEARKELFGDQVNGLYIWEWACMRSFLRGMGVRTAEKHKGVKSKKLKNDWDQIPSLSIVWCQSDIEVRKGGVVGHYVLYDGIDSVYDPLKDEIVKPTELRRKPKSYLQILDRQWRNQGKASAPPRC